MSLPERSGAKRVAETELVGSKIPSMFSTVQAPLNVQPYVVLPALCPFQRGTSLGSFALPPKYLLDAVSGSTVSASIECLNFLTHCINT